MAVWPIFLGCYLAFVVLFMVIPASLGFSFGIRNLYLATLYKLFEVSLGMFTFNTARDQQLSCSFVRGTCIGGAVRCCLDLERPVPFISIESLIAANCNCVSRIVT